MILFLDYDGVLHPDPCPDAARLFENAAALAKTLEPYPGVGIVLSTSWRNVRCQSELLDPLPESLRARVLGKTPRFSEIVPALPKPYRRQAECEQWLREYAMTECPWIALDDRPDWFAPYCENLIVCDSRRGYDAHTSARLGSALALARARTRREVDLLLAA